MRQIQRDINPVIATVSVGSVGRGCDIVLGVLVITGICFDFCCDTVAQIRNRLSVQVNGPVRPDAAAVIENCGESGIYRSFGWICPHDLVGVICAVWSVAEIRFLRAEYCLTIDCYEPFAL